MYLLRIISNPECVLCHVFPPFEYIILLFISIFFAILFLQSGLDKVFDWQGNLSWLKEHFSKTPFRNSVPLLVFTLTAIELLAGSFSLIGVIEIFFFGSYSLAYVGLILASTALLMLFFGQRLAKDYAGAVSIASYFIIAIFGLYLMR